MRVLALLIAVSCTSGEAEIPAKPVAGSAALPVPVVVKPGHANAVKVTVLSTMLVGDGQKGVGEWGFAALLEVDGKRVLVDTGARPETVLKNAEELKIDLASVTDVVLTHGHDDHTGGLVTLRRELRKRQPTALGRAHVGKEFFAMRVHKDGED